MDEAQFVTTSRNGFQMTFGNGITVSLQWGPGTYCDNKMRGYEEKDEELSSSTVEIAAFRDGEWHHFDEENDEVKGWVTPEKAAQFIVKISNGEWSPKKMREWEDK